MQKRKFVTANQQSIAVGAARNCAIFPAVHALNAANAFFGNWHMSCFKPAMLVDPVRRTGLRQ